MGCVIGILGGYGYGYDSDTEREENPPLATTTATSTSVKSIAAQNDDDQKAEAVEELIKSRKDSYHRKARENVASQLAAINAKVDKNDVHNPLHPLRPYGLNEEMQELRRHVWDLVLSHVNDLDTIINLREVCVMFRDLLEMKYVAAQLPEVIVQCLERKTIPWKAGSRTEVSNWVKIMSSLRSLSKASKKSVDFLRDREIPYPNCFSETWKVPTLVFGISEMEQARLGHTLEALAKREISTECLPRVLEFKEYAPNRGPPLALDELQDLRNAFETCLEKIGWRMKSFEYFTVENPLNAYNNLLRWVAHLPNLEELKWGSFSGEGIIHFENVDPFPTCPKLKRYSEGPFRFRPAFKEIIEANPTITEIAIGKSPEAEGEDIIQALDILQLKALQWMGILAIEILEHRFHWSSNLTALTLLDITWTGNDGNVQDTRSDKLFEFVSSLNNLKNLIVASTHIRDTGGYLELPKLQEVQWQVAPNFTSLRFLKLVENLEKLDLDLSSCPPEFKQEEKVKQYLEKWHIPKLFPALKGVRVRTELVDEGNIYFTT